MSKVAIIYTTFLRPQLMYKTYKSILSFMPLEKTILLIGNQGKYNGIKEHRKFYSIYYYDLPFDCGLSYARNFLVNQAKELGCKYCLITADSIEFTKELNLNPIIDFMENKKAGLVGFKLRNRLYWTCDMERKGDSIILDVPRRDKILYKDIQFQPCDMVKNFFLATTESLLDIKWNNELKLAEHIDFFFRYSQKYPVYFTNTIEAKYIKSTNKQYEVYRNRRYNFLKKYLEKNHLKSCHRYTQALQLRFKESKE